MERPNSLEICFICGEQLPSFSKSAKKITGKQRAGGRIEGAERPGKMQIGCKYALQFSAPQIETPALFFDTGKGHVEPQMLEQGDSPPVTEDQDIAAIDHLVDKGQAAGDIRILVVTDKIADMGEGNDLFDLCQGMTEGQH